MLWEPLAEWAQLDSDFDELSPHPLSNPFEIRNGMLPKKQTFQLNKKISFIAVQLKIQYTSLLVNTGVIRGKNLTLKESIQTISD